jgi:integrase
MLTGQRVEEIARLHVQQWGAKERIIDWSKTKNGNPHAIPVPPLAADLIESIVTTSTDGSSRPPRTHRSLCAPGR